MNDLKRYNRILDSCLDSILTQGVPLEDAIAGHPEYQERLRVDLDTALWFQGAGSQFEPRPGFIASSRRYLVSKIGETSLGKARPVTASVFRNIFQARWVLATLLFLVIAWGSLAVGMDKALPGNPIYRVKTTAQDFRLLLTVDEETKASLHRKYAQDQLIACALATSQGQYEDAEIALRNYERHMAGMSRAVLTLTQTSTAQTEWSYIDISKLYLQDMEIFRVLLPGSF